MEAAVSKLTKIRNIEEGEECKYEHKQLTDDRAKCCHPRLKSQQGSPGSYLETEGRG